MIKLIKVNAVLAKEVLIVSRVLLSLFIFFKSYSELKFSLLKHLMQTFIVLKKQRLFSTCKAFFQVCSQC